MLTDGVHPRDDVSPGGETASPAPSGAAQPAPFHWSAVIGNVLSLVLGSAAAQFLMAVSALLTARQLGAAMFGEYASSFAAASFLSILFNLGLDNWLLCQGAYNPQQLGSFLARGLAIKALAGIPWIGVMAVVLPRINPRTFSWQLVLISAAATWFEGLFTLGYSAFKVLLRNELTAVLLIGARGGLLALTLVWIAVGVRAPVSYAYLRLGVSLSAFLATMALLPVKGARFGAHGMGSFRSFVRVGQGAVPFAVSDLFTSIYGQADTTIAAMMLDQEAVGLYATASRLISALYVIPSACYSVILPVLVRVIKEKKESLKIALIANVGLFSIVGCALWFLISYASHLVPAFVLGSSFEASGQIMARLSPVLLVKSLSFAAVVVIVAVGWQKRRVYVQAVVALVNLALSLALVRGLGVEGLAGIQVLSEALLLIGYVGLAFYWVWRQSVRPVQG